MKGMGRRAVQGFVSSDLVSLKKENNKHKSEAVAGLRLGPSLPRCPCRASQQRPSGKVKDV